MKTKSTLRPLLALAGSSILTITSSHAAIRTWGGGDLDWTNTSASGWNAPVPGGADTATINSGTVTVTTNITAANTPNSINVNGGTLVISTGKLVSGPFSTAETFTIGSGGTLRLNSWVYDTAGSLGTLDFGRDRLVVNGGIIEVTGNSTDSGRNFTVGTGGATLRSSVNSGQTWTLSRDGNILYHDIRVNDGRTLTLDGTGNGAIGNYIVNTSGSGKVTKAGAGTWTLSGINTYSGGTSISAGRLELSNNSAAGTGAISLTGATSVLKIGTGIALGNAGNDITITDKDASVVRSVAASSGTYSLGTGIDLKSDLSGGRDVSVNFLSGTNNAASTVDLTMKFATTATASNDGIRRTDLLDLSRTDGTNTFVLQFSTPGGLASDSRLAFWNGVTGGTWTGVGTNFIAGAWNSSYGATYYGFDSTTSSAWAVVDGSFSGGNFTVIPEPSTALGGLLLTAGLLRRRRKVEG